MKVQVAKENFINYCEYEKGLSANTLKIFVSLIYLPI